MTIMDNMPMTTTTYDNDYLWPQEDSAATNNELLVRLYLRTRLAVNSLGCCVFDEQKVLEDLHLTPEAFDEAFSALEKSGQVFKYVRETNELLVKDYVISTNKSINKKLRLAILEDLNQIKSSELMEYFYKNIKGSTKHLRGKTALLKAMKKRVKENALN